MECMTQPQYFLTSGLFGKEGFWSLEDAAIAAVQHSRVHGIRYKVEGGTEEDRARLGKAIADYLY
jgi:hypothetical protein